MQKTLLFLMLLIAFFSANLRADWTPDRINLAYGQFFSPLANRQAELDQYRLGINWDLTQALWASSHLLLHSQVELGFSQWRSTLSNDSWRFGAKKARQISLSPVLRLTGSHSTSPYLDMGLGVSYQSETDLEQKHSSGINMGGNWQFEIRLMLGINLGATPFSLSYGWLHYSNANLASINEGLDFQTLQLTYRFP